MQNRTAKLIVITALVIPELLMLCMWWQARHSQLSAAIPAQAAPAYMMNVQIPHATLGAYHSVGPRNQPAWDISHDPQLVKQYGGNNKGVLLLRCQCGQVIRLLGQHVSADGKVAPSLWHDVPQCGWHVWGTLEGWTAGEWDTVVPAGEPGTKPQSHSHI